MQTRNNSSKILLAVLLILTFPLWIAIGGIMIGLLAGIIGGTFGIIGAIIGTIFGIIGSVFGWIFDWDHFEIDLPFTIWNTKLFVLSAIVLIIVLVTRSRKI